MRSALILVFSLISAGAVLAAAANSPAYLEGYRALATEPKRASVSIPAASHFLKTVSLKWTRQNKCGTCHTNLAHVMAEPFLEQRDAAAEREIRESLFAFLASYNPNEAEVAPESRRANNNILWNRLIIAATFAMSDGEAKVPQDPRTLTRFDQIWAMQNDDGSFNYPKKALPFLEDDKIYVQTMLAIAASYLPADYLAKPAAAAGLAKLHAYLKSAKPADHHGELVLLRAALKAPELMGQAARADLISRTLKLQREDGGWALASLGDWPREDGGRNPKDGPSDGYGTGFVLYALCKAGVPKDGPAVTKGLAWLGANQRASGRWFTKSLWSDEMHNYVSTIGTAYAVMAMKECKA